MHQIVRRIVFITAVLCAASPAASLAMSFVSLSDDDLYRGSELIIEGQVVERGVGLYSGRSRSGAAEFTDYRVRLDEVYKGFTLSSHVVVSVPGVHPSDGYGWRVEHAPRFQAGQRVLFFLRQAADGSWRLHHMGLSAFRLVENQYGDFWARDIGLGEDLAEGFNSRYLRHRHIEHFRTWLRQPQRSGVGPSQYLVSLPAPLSFQYSEGVVSNAESSEILRGRWNRFEQEQDVYWHHLDEQQLDASIDQAGVVQRALAAWTNDRDSQVRYRYGGPLTFSEASENQETEQFNVVLWANPFPNPEDDSPPYGCGSAGVLGWTGWLPVEGEGATHFHQGQEYDTIRFARVVVNQGAECRLNGPMIDGEFSGVNARELVAHEMGHALGFSHSCEDEGSGSSAPVCEDKDTPVERIEAIMRYNHHGDRGAVLNSFDRQRLAAVYTAGAETSSFLMSLQSIGTGSGTLSVETDSIETEPCGTHCDLFGPSSESVTITADSGPNSVFLGWGGDCSGKTGDSITVPIGSGRHCTAQFHQLQANESVIEINRPACGVDVEPDQWRVFVEDGEPLLLEVTPSQNGLEVFVDAGLCGSSREDDSNIWRIDPVQGFGCVVDIFLQSEGALPDCDPVFVDRFEP